MAMIDTRTIDTAKLIAATRRAAVIGISIECVMDYGEGAEKIAYFLVKEKGRDDNGASIDMEFVAAANAQGDDVLDEVIQAIIEGIEERGGGA